MQGYTSVKFLCCQAEWEDKDAQVGKSLPKKLVYEIKFYEIGKLPSEEEEKRKSMQYETEMSKRRAEYQVQLELQRDQ